MASVWSQKGMDPTVEQIEFAKTLREKHPKSAIAITESSDNISFALNKAQTKVMVYRNTDEVLMNIDHRANIAKYEFYDSESSIEAFNFTYRNGKKTNFFVKDEFYKDNDFFYNDAKVKYSNLSFPVQGYSLGFKLEKTYYDVKYFTSLYFNDEYPVLKKQIKITIPDWLQVELKEFNFDGYVIKKEIVIDSKTKASTYIYNMDLIEAFHKEENTPGKSYIYPHILVIAKSFKAQNKEVTLFNSASDLYKWDKSMVDLMKEDTSVLKDKVNELTSMAKNDEEKIKNIYYWVQDNIRYIAFEDGIAGFKPDESNHVFEKRYGDCKGMANLTKQMLKIAGFDARLAWIGTKHIFYDFTSPSLAVNNHMICTLFYKGKKYFLDGTEKFNSFGEYAERIQNKDAMIEDGDQFIIEKVPVMDVEMNREIVETKLNIQNEKLIGNSSKFYNGESRAQFLNNYHAIETDKKENALERYLSKSDKNIELTNIKTSDLKNRDLQLTLNYNIAIKNKVSSFENDIYVDLDYTNEFKNFEFKDRKTDYVFDSKKNMVSNTKLAIPSGYKVAKMPEDLTVSEDNFSAKITFSKTDTEILYNKSFIFKNAVIKVNEMNKWNEFIKKLNELYNQQIVLTKQ